MLQKMLKPASWVMILGLVIVTVVPANERPVTGFQHDIEHFFAFALAGLTFGLAYAQNTRVNLLSAFVFTLVLELSQIPLATRHARLRDFMVDAAAACLGIVIGHLCRKLVKDQAVAA
jgi:VanZ family protein